MVSNIRFLAVSGLPGFVRSAWAKELAAEQEGMSPWAHSDLWHDLRQAGSHLPANRWEQPSGTDGTATMLREQDLADLAAAASAGEEVSGRHPNVSSTMIGRVADRLVERHPGLRVLVFYQSPWEAFEEACRLHRLRGAEEAATWLSYWIRYHEDVLSARLRAPGCIFMVNAARLRGRVPALLEVLRAEGIVAPEGALSRLSRQRIGSEPQDLLAAHMTEHGPECWDMYEALESSALLLGRDPEFRDVGPGQGAHGLGPVLGLWSDALSAREVQVENDLLQKQLQHLQDELGQYIQANEAMREALRRSTDVANQARTLLSGLLGEPGED
jgi:hypothetical protein